MSNGDNKAGPARDKALHEALVALGDATTLINLEREKQLAEARAAYDKAVKSADVDYQKAIATGG